MKKNTRRFISFWVFVLITGLIVVGCGNKNTAENFQQQFSKGNITEASAIYSQLKEESDKNACVEYANTQIDQAYNDFVIEKATYESAKKVLEGALGLNEVATKANENLKKLDALSTSRTAFTDAQKFQDAKNYTQALIEYSKVIKDDKNYDIAQTKIKELSKTAKLLTEPLDLNAINSTNSDKSDAKFVGKYYRVTGIIDQAMKPSDGLNAMVIIEPDVMAKGMGSTLPLEINIWLTADEFEKIGGISSVGKQIDLSVNLTSISRNAISKDPAVKGYPIQLEFGEHD